MTEQNPDDTPTFDQLQSDTPVVPEAPVVDDANDQVEEPVVAGDDNLERRTILGKDYVRTPESGWRQV